MSDYKTEQHRTIKFCLKLEMNATKTCGKLKEAYGKDALSRTQIFKWFKNFSAGRDSVEISLDGRDQQHQILTKM